MIRLSNKHHVTSKVMRTDSRCVVISGIAALSLFISTHYLRRVRPPIEDSTSKEVQAPAQERTTGNTASNFQNQIRNRVEINRRQREENALTKQIEGAASEAERKRRENWEANFPFTPQYHPTLTFDPSLYDPNDPSTFNTDPELELAVKRHSYMVSFFNNPLRLSAEFEQLHSLLSEIDRADNPEILGDVFVHLQNYHKARQFAPKNVVKHKRTRAYDPSRDPPDPLLRPVIEWRPVDGETTWGDKAGSASDAIVGLLVLAKYWPNREPLSVTEARKMRDRLLAEIPSEMLLEYPTVTHHPDGRIGVFGYNLDAQKSLLPGDPLLTPFPIEK
jgi:hypothetical protein